MSDSAHDRSGLLALVALASPFAFAIPVAAPAAAAQAVELEASAEEWEFTGDTGVGIVDGLPTLLLRTGEAIRRDVTFEDGVIEFDYRGTDERAFLGVTFRVAEDGTAEDVYLRLHKSNQPDALQYTPDYRGRGQWQLFHGPSATAYLDLEADDWTPVRVEVAGSRARVTVGESAEAQLVVHELVSGSEVGHVAFWANQPGGDAGSPLTAALRNIRVTHGRAGPIPEGGPPRPPFGLVRAWGVSGSFVREGDDVTELPSGAIGGTWTEVVAGPDGLAALEPHVRRPDAEGVPAVLAGLTIDTDAARTVRFDFGFSDDVSLFLNGRLLYSGHHSFSTNFPRRQGLITLDQASLYLPLEAGRNRLVLAVSEVFGGWGVMGRVVEREGLTIRPMRSGAL